MISTHHFLFCTAWLLVAFPRILVAGEGEQAVSFRKDIAPILIQNCIGCHGPKKSEGSYRADSFALAAGEGDTGSPGFAPHDPDSSEAFLRITSDDPEIRMPLDDDPLPGEQIELIRRWIDEGAAFDGDDPAAPLWSIVPPPIHPDPPEVYPNALPITALAFTPGGGELVIGGYHELTVWDPDSGKLLRRLGNVSERTYALAFSPDGSLLAVAGGQPGRSGEIRLFDPRSGEMIRVLKLTTDVMLDLAFSPSGDKLAAGGADSILRVFALPAGDEQLTIASHSDWVMAVAWKRDGKQLASASRDKTAKVFDVETGDLLATYSGHGEPVKGVAFHPNGSEVYSAAADKQIHKWKIEDGKKTADVAKLGGEVYRLTTGRSYFFVASADKTARQFDIKTHKQLQTFKGHQDWVLATAFHSGAQRVATGSFDGEVHIWNLDGTSARSFPAIPQ